MTDHVMIVIGIALLIILMSHYIKKYKYKKLLEEILNRISFAEATLYTYCIDKRIFFEGIKPEIRNFIIISMTGYGLFHYTEYDIDTISHAITELIGGDELVTKGIILGIVNTYKEKELEPLQFVDRQARMFGIITA